jgi:hypothetical protein
VGEKLLNRKFAAVAIATSVLLGTTACTFSSPVATMKVYTPSDGTDANFGEVAARNIFILVAPSGQTALFGSFLNGAETQQPFSLEIGGQTYALNLSQFEKLDMGFNGRNALPLSGVSAKAGSLVKATFKSDGESVEKTIPVLDGTFAQYAPLVNSLGIIAPSAEPTEAPK